MLAVRERLLGLLPRELYAALEAGGMEEAEEIRLRRGYPPSLLVGGREKGIGKEAVGEREIAFILDRASQSSLHWVQSQLLGGFVQAGAGIRLGVCGSFTEKGIPAVGELSSLSIRLPRELRGIGAEVMGALWPFESSVLIISPPGGGKTSFLRELIRKASESGKRVCLCDERCEVAAMWGGKSSFELGPCTDVLSGMEKSKAIIMLLRAMNPEIIALDEISAETDGPAMEQAISCGAYIIATAHGRSLEEIRARPYYENLLNKGLFQKAVIISGRSKRSYEVKDI